MRLLANIAADTDVGEKNTLVHQPALNRGQIQVRQCDSLIAQNRVTMI